MTDTVYFRRLAITIAALAAAVLLWWLKIVILLLFAAVIIAILIRSLSNPIRMRFRLVDAAAVAIAIGILAVLTMVAFALFGWRMAGQFAQLLDLLPKAFNHFLAWLNSQPLGAPVVASFRKSGASSALPAILHLPAYALALLGGMADVLLVLAGGIYLSYQPALYRNGLLNLLPTAQRKPVAKAMDDTGHTLRMWLLAQLAAMAIVGSMVALGTWALGVPAAGALGLFAGAVEFVPIAGPIASAVPALLLALLVGADTAGWTLLLFIAIQQLEGNVIVPLLQQRAIRIPPLVTLFALVLFGVVLGPLGVVLATPLTILTAEAIDYVRSRDS